jgi:hypothetical protein
MARLAWTIAGSRYFEAGVDRGVLYIDALAGLPWVGLISVDENPTGGEAQPYYIDGVKYLNLSKAEEFEATIKAFTYPVEFSQCDGTDRVRSGLFFSQQRRKSFGFSYRTMIGNDVNGLDLGYKIHLIYNALVTPASRSASTFADSIEASDFSWSLTTKPRTVSGYGPTSHVIIDSRYTEPEYMAAIEDILYGTDSDVARLITPEELIAIFDAPIEWIVIDEGGGRYFVGGPEENVSSLGDGKYNLDHPDVADGGDTITITY